MTTPNRPTDYTYPSERRPMPHGPMVNWLDTSPPTVRKWPWGVRVLFIAIMASACWAAVGAFLIGLAACLQVHV